MPSLKLLINSVREHREGLLVIDPNADVDLRPDWQLRVKHEICLQMQEAGLKCQSVDDEGKERTLWTGLTDLVRRWSQTKKNWEEAGKPFVSQEEADRRAEICKKCAENRPVVGCAGCSGFAAEVTSYLSGMKTLKDEDLHTCFRCGCYIRSKVWIPLEVIDNQGADFTDLPWCWQNPSPSSS